MMNRIKSNVYMMLAMAVCFAVGSCSGEEGSSPLHEVSEVPANPDALCTITPHAIKINGVDASTTPITRSATTGKPEQQATYAANLGSNSSIEATLEAEPEDARTRAAGSLAADAQYRIVVFKGSEIVGNVVYKQGSTAVVSGETIKLKKGTYRLFAYTFNSADNIRGLDADNENVTVNTSGEDFMTYTVPNYTVSSTDYGSGKQLNISFVRQFARLTVRIIADGFTDNTITSANLTVGYVFGSFSYQWDGTYNDDDASIPPVAGMAALTKATASGASVDCGPSADNPYLITSHLVGKTVKVLELFVDRRGDEVALSEFDFPNPVTLVKGGSYRLTITICNYYLLTRTNPVTIGGVKWARTNLQQTGAGVSAPVSFTANPWDYGSYWNWGMRDAAVYGANVYLSDNVDWNTYTSSGTNQNPCRALGSGWRLPTADEQGSLANNPAPSGSKVKINGTINTIGNYGWVPDVTGAVFISGNQAIFLPAAGYRFSFGSVNDPGSSGYYWSGTPGSSAAASFLYFDSGYLGVGYGERTNGYSLRCVQN